MFTKSILATSLLSMLMPAMSMGMLKATEGGGGSTILDLDSMMDTAMNTVKTLPDFITPPAGDYLLKVTEAKAEKYKQKAKDGQPEKDAMRLKIFYSVEKTLQCEGLPVKDGSLFSESFMATEEGLQFFKRQAINILNVADLDDATLKDVMVGLKDAEFKARITIRMSPNPAGGTYENVQVRPVHEAAAS